MSVSAISARKPELRDQAGVTADAQRLLREAEAAVDAALQAVGRVGVFVPEARMRLGVSGVVAQGVFDDAVDAQLCLTRARASLVKVHNGMEAVRRKFGMPLASAPEPKTSSSAVPQDAGSEAAAAA